MEPNTWKKWNKTYSNCYYAVINNFNLILQNFTIKDYA